jgi:hypothetical protein
MMRYIGFEREEEAEAWARERIKIKGPTGFFRAASAVDEAGDFVCVVVMSNFTSKNIDLNIAMNGKKMLPKGTVLMFNEIFGFVFNKLQAIRVTGLVHAENSQAKKINEHFGFKLEGVMRKAFDGADMHIYGFLAEEYHSHPWHRAALP